MSTSDTGDEEIPGREIAYRLFAAEYDDASLSYAESDEERAPNYVISPTGARLNRLFVVGTLTEVTAVNDEMVRARVVDPTGAFVVYAGQYQPDELAALEQLEPPAFVAVTGKARTFQPDDSDQVYTSIRPESIATVDADTRDRWVINAAEQTLGRIGIYAEASQLEADGDVLTETLREAGVESGLAAGVPLAQDHYGTTPSYLTALRDCALEAVEVVAGDRDQVSGLPLSPSDSPDESATFESFVALSDAGIESTSDVDTGTQPEQAPSTTAAGTDTTADVDSEPVGTAAATGTATSMDRETTADDGAETASTTDLGTDSSVSAESTLDSGAESDDTEASEPDDSVTAVDDSHDEPTTFDESTDLDDALDTAESATTDDDGSGDDELEDFDAGDSGMYEMDEAEREELEAEFGAEFTTGSEVDDPGAADIDVPEPETEPENLADESAALEADETDDVSDESDVEERPADETDADDSGSDEPDETPADDVDLQSYVVETMEELDAGEGADRTELVETVAEELGVPEAEIEDAIQDALMGGECYEPNDEMLKAI